MTFVPLSPIPLKDRTSMIFLQYGQIDVLDGAFVLINKTGIRTHIPVGSVACIMLEPGTSFPRGGASGRHGGDATGLGR